MTEGSANYYYRLKLNFSTKVFGIFKQTVIFDFGTKPLLAKVLVYIFLVYLKHGIFIDNVLLLAIYDDIICCLFILLICK